jgi:hypothetical protein
MKRDDAQAGDQQFSDLLAAYDEALAKGEPPQQATLPPELAERLAQAQACLRRLEQHRRGTPEPARTPRPEHTPVEGLSLDGQGGIRQVGRWQFLRELGRGGSGIVYLAWDPLLHREVAVKVPRPEVLLTPELRQRFLREAQAAAGFEHPNLVPVYEAGEVGAFCYIVSAYCRGTTLGTWLKQQDGFAAPRAAELVAAFTDAVGYIHRRGVLHRDIKPNNIRLTALEVMAPEAPASDHGAGTTDACALVPKLTDFGLAKQARESGEETKSGTLLGAFSLRMTVGPLSIASGPDGNRLAASHADGTLPIWNATPVSSDRVDQRLAHHWVHVHFSHTGGVEDNQSLWEPEGLREPARTIALQMARHRVDQLGRIPTYNNRIGSELWPTGWLGMAQTVFTLAVNRFRKNVSLNPGKASAYGNFAWFLVTCPDPSFRDAARALTHAQKAVALDPANAGFAALLGMAQYRVGEWQAAVVTLEKAVAGPNLTSCLSTRWLVDL